MHALSVRQLVKVYANGVQALAGVDLDVPRGDFCALLGPNGAGKTSLIGIVTSLVRKTSGEVSVFGHDLDRELNAVKSAIGVVPQEINLNLWDKVSNIVVNQAGFYGVPPARARRRAETCLRQLQLWDKRHDFARTLSGGMKRRLMIARAAAATATAVIAAASKPGSRARHWRARQAAPTAIRPRSSPQRRRANRAQPPPWPTTSTAWRAHWPA